MTLSKIAAVVAFVATCAGTGLAYAATGLSGDTISATYNYPTLGNVCCGDIQYSNPSFVVSGGVETTLTAAGVPYAIDFEADSLTITEGTRTFNSGSAFNGPVFIDVTGGFGHIQSVSGLDAALVAIQGNQLQINWGGVPLQSGQQIVVRFGFGSGVPEPATWSMMLVGLGGLGAAMRGSRQVKALLSA